MISLHSCPDLSSIGALKSGYLGSLTSPMDGMWNTGITDPAPHWEIRVGDEQAGYCVIDAGGTLLQFHIRPAFEAHGPVAFNHVVGQAMVNRAVASTNDPVFLSLCLDVEKGLEVHTHMYELALGVAVKCPDVEGFELRLVGAPDLDRVIAFQLSCLGDKDGMSSWLRGYSARLIERGELFALCNIDEWVGLGECRKSDSQEGVADLGMMVSPDFRGRRWATHILKCLIAHSTAEGLRPICSTTVDNPAAQSAIRRAGFVARHRIVNVAL